MSHHRQPHYPYGTFHKQEASPEFSNLTGQQSAGNQLDGAFELDDLERGQSGVEFSVKIKRHLVTTPLQRKCPGVETV